MDVRFLNNIVFLLWYFYGVFFVFLPNSHAEVSSSRPNKGWYVFENLETVSPNLNVFSTSK
jgi:hypothetical protein